MNRTRPTSLSMAKTISSLHKWLDCKYPKPPLSIIFIFIAIIDVSGSQPTTTDCQLDFRDSFFGNSSDCEGGKWGNFLSKNCCGIAFDGYLYALGRRANQTGKIYLNETEQRNCLDSMKIYYQDILSCGIEKLTSGAGGCSDLTIRDVDDKLGNELISLRDDCKFSDSGGNQDSECGVCSQRWRNLGGTFHKDGESVKIDTDICRFTVLVSLTSSMVDDEWWVRPAYRCLGELNATEVAEQQSISISKKGSMSKGLWVLLIVGIVGILLVIILATWILLKQSSESNSLVENDGHVLKEKSLPVDTSCQKIPIKEIYAATTLLDASNFIGQGIAGKVYKGVLSNGWEVAVKHIIKDGHLETFFREVKSLSHVKHPNLVTLLGYCDEEDECFLVYELCTNGNLAQWIFDKNKSLSWIQRLEVAIDCARGLWFLHTYPEGCIVHRDIKPTNILLGDAFEAKLSDFGLSKVMDVDQSYVSSEVRGTFGYVDPEYQRNHHVNPSTDVYSFGMVLLQILSGKRVIDLNVKSPMHLDKMARFLTRGGHISEFADPKLNGEYSMDAFDLTFKLALSCTAYKQQRPSMEQVVKRLQEALEISGGEALQSGTPSRSFSL